MKTIFSRVDDYISSLFAEEDEVLKKVIQGLELNSMPQASISATQGKLLQILSRTCQAKRILEIGTLGGYSTIYLARTLPDDGKMITLELLKNHADLAESHVKIAGLADKVEIRVGNALQSLKDMLGNEPPFDFIFIDADKPPYTEYFQLSLQLSRPGTLIVADNVVRNGKLLDENSEDSAVRGVQRFLQYLGTCDAAHSTVLQNVGVKEYDGMSLSLVK